MARLSDLTYLTRAVFVSWTFLWFLQHAWNIDRFEALKWGRVKKHDLKSVITILLVIMCPLQAFYDISSSILKYQEGFWVNPLNGNIVTKPDIYWSEANKNLVVPSNYILCANFSLMTCLLFLLQSFWNYLAKNIAKSSFMGSFEFKSYIVFAIFSVFIFPFLQFFFRHDLLLTEVVPQLAYSVLMFLIAIFGLRSHQRFTNLLRLTRKSSASQINIIAKLEYFRDMNRYLTWSLFLGSLSIMSLSIDGLTTEKYLNSHKFTSDFIMCNMSFALWIVFVTLMLIFYPSTNTISDSAALKGASFSGNAKNSLKNDTLDPPNPQWIRSLNADDSQWSSQISSQQTISQVDSNNSYSISIYEELPPPVPYHRKSNSLDLPHTPPSPYRPSPSIPPNTLPPPPPIPTASASASAEVPSSSPKIRQKLIIQPPVLSYSTQLTQSPTSPIKPSKLEKLKYPSTPLLSRNNSFDNGLGSDNNQSTSSLVNNPAPIQSNTQIISPSPRKVFVDYSLNSPTTPTKPTLPKKSSRRPSVTSNDSYPVIRNMTSTTSLSSVRSANSITLPSSDEDDKESSTINKITNLDTRKVAPFMYQDGPPVQQERSIPPVSHSHLSNNVKAEQSQRSIFQRDIPTEVSSQSIPKLNSIKSSPVVVQQSQRIHSFVVDDNNNNNGSSAPKVVSTPKSSTINNTSRTPLKSKTQTITRTYQNSPLGPGGKGGIGMNEITSSTSNPSTVKKYSPAQINNSKISIPKGRSGVVAVGAANSVKNSGISTRSRSNSTASVGSNKVNSTSTTSNERNSVRSSVSSVNSVSNNVRNSLVKSRTRSNSTASVGVRNSVRSSTSSGAGRTSIISQNGKTAGRVRSISSASSSSISSVSSSSSSSSSGSIKKVIKTGVGKIRRDSRVS